MFAVVIYEEASQENLRDNIFFENLKDLFGPRVIAVEISDGSEFGKEFQRQQLIRLVAANVFGIDNRGGYHFSSDSIFGEILDSGYAGILWHR